MDYFPDDPTLSQLGVAALAVRTFVAKTPTQISRSFGGIPRPNPAGRYGNNRLEGTPHGPIHNYVGGVDDQGNGGDMSDFETAGRDPIFFAHHGNLDRLWEIWRQDAARKATEPSTDDFLGHPFVFTWLDGTNIQVPAGDTLDTTKLGFVYDSLEVFRPNAPPVIAAQATPSRLPPVATGKLRVPLSPQGVGSGERKILEITDVEKPDRLITVGVYVKPSDAPASEPGINVGSFAAVKAGKQIAWPSQTLTFDITAAALQRETFEFVGLIGSETKRARFATFARQVGVTARHLDRLVCPIGITEIKGKEPAVIAAALAAQLLVVREHASIPEVSPATQPA